jgi:hypothetical protein
MGFTLPLWIAVIIKRVWVIHKPGGGIFFNIFLSISPGGGCPADGGLRKNREKNDNLETISASLGYL